tara:strand:- start:230 stop:1330 length:1101 start_codon:yes stop_codon:yes gene_type:complete
MKVSEIMERAGIGSTGRAIAYIKDGLEEIEMHTKQNVVRGALASTTSTGISFLKSDVESSLDSNIFSGWTTTSVARSSGYTGGIWTVFESEALTDSEFEQRLTSENFSDGTVATGPIMKILFKQDLFLAKTSGISANITGLTNGATYTLSVTFNPSGLNTSSVGQQQYASVGSAAPSPAPNSSYGAISNNATEGTNTKTLTFTAAATNVHISLYATNGDDSNTMLNKFCEFGNISLTPNAAIFDSNSGFGSFTTDMKLFVSNSTSNNTDESANAENGYYNISSASSSKIEISGGTLTDESAGESITVRGQTINYMDIIKDKRFYPLPNDMLKLIDVKVKNHKNGNDKYRSVERMIYKPSEQDGDNV